MSEEDKFKYHFVGRDSGELVKTNTKKKTRKTKADKKDEVVKYFPVYGSSTRRRRKVQILLSDDNIYPKPAFGVWGYSVMSDIVDVYILFYKTSYWVAYSYIGDSVVFRVGYDAGCEEVESKFVEMYEKCIKSPRYLKRWLGAIEFLKESAKEDESLMKYYERVKVIEDAIKTVLVIGGDV